jgi:predicted Zn-dependent peptidase
MKKIYLGFILLIISSLIFAQVPPQLTVKSFKLENGLTIYLNEDHSKPEVFGAIVVNTGSKNDPKDATGTAHYFEHMMFKGTDQIGTLNWQTEKIYLDSMTVLYDSLSLTKEEAARNAILLHINKISIAASEYAIPNETDIILQNIGGTGLNAYTSLEQTVYFNSFPANQLEKWMTIYAERFRNPVFRLFQSELETVYEEKNMYADNAFSNLFEQFSKSLYKNHPYGQQTTIGTTESLKNPRISKMMEFYKTNYVANNMALVISGDINSEAIIPLIKKYFGNWKSSEVPKYPVYEEKPFNGRELVVKKLTPIKIGILAYRGVPNKHKDELVLDICSQILSNEGQTGLFDKLVSDSKLMAANAEVMKGNDLGSLLIVIVPKIIGQSLEKAEKLVLEQIENLKKGNFDNSLLDAIKLNYRKSVDQRFESSQGRSMMLISAFSEGRQWEDYLNESAEVEKITKEDIIRVANQYFTGNYLAFFSKMGFPKKDKITKPNWAPVIPKNSEKKSEFASQLNNIPDTKIEPRFVNFNKDLTISTIKSGIDFYYTNNPINTIFTLTLKYKIGINSNNMLAAMANYMNFIGTKDKSIQEFRKALQNIGATFRVWSSNNNILLEIDGFESKLEPTLKLIAEFMNNPKADEKQLDKLVQGAKMEYKTIKADAESMSDVLNNYSMFKENSEYLKHLSIKETKKLKGDQLIALFKDVLQYECEIHYVGKLSVDEVNKTIGNTLPFAITPKPAVYIENQVTEANEPIIYIYDDPKALQSKMTFWCNGSIPTEEEKAKLNGFNEYFGAGMSSIVFQEIREFRSLSYSAYAYYTNRFLKTNKGYLYAGMGTQSDKTIEGVQVMTDLIKNMPQKPDRMESIKKGLLQAIHTQNSGFRNLSQTVSSWKFQGYNSDPREYRMQVYNNLQFSDVQAMYEKFVKGKPIVITITGNMKKVDLIALAKFGKVIKVNEKLILKK